VIKIGDLTSDVIMAISDNPKTADVNYIAWHSYRTKKVIRNKLNKLNKKGIINKSKHPKDKRKNVYKLSKNWRAKLKKIKI